MTTILYCQIHLQKTKKLYRARWGRLEIEIAMRDGLKSTRVYAGLPPQPPGPIAIPGSGEKTDSYV